MPAQKNFWLLKTEPVAFSIEDLRNAPGGISPWDGVRNYQARNLMRDAMRPGDGVLIYHSNAKPLAIVGTGEVAGAGYPDKSQFDPQSRYFDSRATLTTPVWYCVDIRWQSTFARPVLREVLQHHPGCQDLMLLRRGARLSVQPVPQPAWELILALARG